MASTEPNKRELKLESFDQVMAEVRSLHQNGYKSNGNWNLAQCCGHLAVWVMYPIDGFPKAPLPIRVMIWAMKRTIAPSMARKILAEGFKGGMATAPISVPSRDSLSDEQAVEQLQQAYDRALAFEGELIPSPLFGPMDKALHQKVSLLHAEHHLGYLSPEE